MSARALAVWVTALSMLLLPVAAAQELDLSTPAPQAGPAAPQAAGLSDAPLMDSAPIRLRCPSVMLVEMESGQIIFEKNADERRQAASVTKVMTILLTLEALDEGRVRADQPVPVSANSSGMGGSQVLLDTGETQPLSVLLESVIVGSANDAAVALAECLYGSEELFVGKMNQRAGELGMEDTVFVNCTGLPAEGQYTTARDVAAMAMQMFAHPAYYEYSGIWMDEVDHGDGRRTQLTNTNKLIRQYDGCDGGKTGSTKAAGYCIAATAKRGDMRLIAVVLGGGTSTDRFDDAKDAFDYGFANFRLYPVARAGTRIRGEIPVSGGERDGVGVELAGNLTLLVLKGEEQSVELEPDLPARLAAPIAAGQRVGSVRVLRGGRLLAEIPVTASHDVAAKGLGGIVGRMWRSWPLT